MIAMKRILLIVACTVALAGCQPDQQPAEKASSQPEPSQPAAMIEESVPKPEPAPEPEWPEYTEEQTAAARQMVTDLGVAIKEDTEGNVISVDTAANRSWVDNYQMEEILAFPRLTSLTVEGPSIDDTLAPKIAEQAGLASLAMRNTLISDEGLAQFAKLKFLKVIDLRLCPMVTNSTLETLSAMPELRAVRISGTNVTDDGIAAILALPQLRELDIRNCRGVTRAAIEQLAGRKSLRVLKIGGEKIDDGVLESVGKLDTLTGLSLDNCPITDTGVAMLAGLPLTDLTIYQCAKVTDKGVEILAEMDRLTKLTLRDVDVQGTVLSRLPKPELLVSLNLGQSKITDAEIGLLEPMKKLDTLVLSETAVSGASVDTLAKLGSLKRLIVTQTPITAEGVEKLQDALPDCEVQAN
jgi:Leucine-rich repeat (LRR) protein